MSSRDVTLEALKALSAIHTEQELDCLLGRPYEKVQRFVEQLDSSPEPTAAELQELGPDYVARLRTRVLERLHSKPEAPRLLNRRLRHVLALQQALAILGLLDELEEESARAPSSLGSTKQRLVETIVELAADQLEAAASDNC